MIALFLSLILSFAYADGDFAERLLVRTDNLFELNLQPRYLGEQNRGVYYLKDAEMADAEVFLDLQRRLVDRFERSLGGERGAHMIYVVDTEGQMRAMTPKMYSRMDQIGANPEAGRTGFWHHSTLAQGRAVLGAGEMFVKDGLIEMISQKSGHYRPSLFQLRNLIENLIRIGVELRYAKVTIEIPVPHDRAKYLTVPALQFYDLADRRGVSYELFFGRVARANDDLATRASLYLDKEYVYSRLEPEELAEVEAQIAANPMVAIKAAQLREKRARRACETLMIAQ